MFRRLGSFHFVQDHKQPIHALRSQLTANDVADSLVVLPEAFNFGKHYRAGGRYLHDPDSIRDELKVVAGEFSVTFVVSLLRRGRDTSIDNVALIIRSDEVRPVCKKTLNDGTGNYTPCSHNCDIENPLILDGCAIGVSICMDVDDHARFRTIVEATEIVSAAQRFICVPAAMSNSCYFNGGRLGYRLMLRPQSADNTHVILANSDPNGPSSFITSKDGTIVAATPVDQKDRSRLVMLDSEETENEEFG